MKRLRELLKMLRNPMQAVDRLAHGWLRRRGYATVEAEPLRHGRRQLVQAFEYVTKSGHLNTVSGRRPRAIDRLKNALSVAYILTSPDVPGESPDTADLVGQ